MNGKTLKVRAPRTLLARLLGWIFGGFFVVWVGFTAIGFVSGLREADELTDGYLSSTASLLLSQGDNVFTQERATMPTPPGNPMLQAHEFQQSMSVVVWDPNGRVLSHTGKAPLPPFDSPDGYGVLKLGAEQAEWRSFAKWQTPDRSRRVIVLISGSERDDLAWHLGTRMAETGLWLMIVVAAVATFAVKRGLRPLQALSDEVDKVDVQDPKPLSPADRPVEFAAVVNAIDTLIGRYRAALLREQELTSEFAHEIRTPLTSLSLNAGALRDAHSSEQKSLLLSRIETDAMRAGETVRQLVALARANRAVLSGAVAPVDLAALVRRIVAEHAPVAFESRHELGLDAPESWTVLGHSVLLEAALRNLVENAVAHTPAGTTVEVQVDALRGLVQVCDDGGRQPSVDAVSTELSPSVGDARRALGFGLGHRVVERVATLHGAVFSKADPPVGFTTNYRIDFGRGGPSGREQKAATENANSDVAEALTEVPRSGMLWP